MSQALREDLQWLYSLESTGIKLGLSNVRLLLKELGDPQERFGTIHVAGSNGKGSVSAMGASILRSAGYRTGLYTSPHLVRFTERMTVDGKEMSEACLAKHVTEMRELASSARVPRPLTFFEITTALAFLHFSESGVEEAVVEVGMGGRLDATNVIRPRCCVITPISVEHTAYLGDTLSKIAYEKASIIKDGVPVICSPQDPKAARVISWMAECRGSAARFLGRDFQYECVGQDLEGTTVRLDSLGAEVRLGMLGRYQCQNAAVAAEAALEVGKDISITRDSIVDGLFKARWPGRLDVVRRSPLTVLDVTHTPDGAKAVASELTIFPGNPRVMVVGMLRDKDARGAMAHLAPMFDQVICTSSTSPRALSPGEMLEAARPFNASSQAVEGVGRAIDAGRAIAGQGGLLFISGSLYTIGEAMQHLEVRHGP
ncbi:MAG: bifunctional folylpolyglutamate synthase/ dihydrofolate synthase [Methanomassiliicoccales archaeon PtaB.Bin215]|nr:MAG: bifunctional folylpolyglutamate synthase/ dihydrofolate synthase [Methanomassiliicoccales archaeon PtaB.Bin215]